MEILNRGEMWQNTHYQISGTACGWGAMQPERDPDPGKQIHPIYPGTSLSTIWE